MSDRPDELPDDVRALLLAAERDAPPSPPEGARAMVLDRVFATVSAAPVLDAPQAPAPPPSLAAPAAVGIARFALASLAVVGAVVVTAVVASRERASSAPRPPRGAAPSAPSRAAPATVVEHTISRSLPSASPSAVTLAPAAQPSAPPRAVTARRASVEESPEELAAEQRLLAEGQRALARGDAAAVLDAVRAHAQRFARGALAEERDALEVRALLLARRDDEARARAARFRRRYPDSVFLAAIEARLGER